MTDTIAAIATPSGTGGIGVIRISGPGALKVICGLFGPSRAEALTNCRHLESHRVYHGYIFDDDGVDVIDEVLLIPMLAPSSYTAEDVVEIQAHAGTIVLRTILDRLLSNGARLAEPGEFTKRAFLNQRIDLTQAEAVADIINARSSTYLKFATSQSTGALKQQIQEFVNSLTHMLACIEAGIDFPEDVESFSPSQLDIQAVDTIIQKCTRLIQQHNDACFFKDGVRLSICGPPNVGKSSLMNRLISREKSIVTPVPGTTRDPIEEGLNIQGVPFVISDTAGIHKTDDLVEIIGIEKAKDQIRQSDLVLLIVEPERLLSLKQIYSMVPEDKKLILVINKIDLFKDKPRPTFPSELSSLPRIEISALYNQGVESLKDMIINMSIRELDLESSTVIPNLRHKKALETAVLELEAVKAGLIDHNPPDMLAIDLENAIQALGAITGETARPDILDTIFSHFCIGK